MANRRMFSKSVVQSSQFLRMPATSRLLYYDLGMAADDDGFVEWYTVLRMTGATEQDLQVIQANNFVHIFDDRALVIIDWKENNYLRNDRYQPSRVAQSLKFDVSQVQNGRYTFGIPSGIPVVDKMDTQVRIGEVRKGKDNKNIATFTATPTASAVISEEDTVFLEAWKAITNTTIRTKLPQNVAAAKRLKERYSPDFVKRMVETVRMIKADKYAGRNLQAIGNYIELEKHLEKVEQYRQGLDDRKSFTAATSPTIVSI